jgi:hypothetical protein
MVYRKLMPDEVEKGLAVMDTRLTAEWAEQEQRAREHEQTERSVRNVSMDLKHLVESVRVWISFFRQLFSPWLAAG